MATKVKSVTKFLKDDVAKKQQYRIVRSEVKAAFTQDSNKTITVGLVAEINDSQLEDVNDIVFNLCLEEVNRLLMRVGR